MRSSNVRDTCGNMACGGALADSRSPPALPSSAAARPKWNAARLSATSTPFSSMAFSNASKVTGNAPLWKAQPSRNTLAPVATPKCALVDAWASTATVSRARARRCRSCGVVWPASSPASTNAAVGAVWSFTTASVRFGESKASTSRPAAVI